MLQSSATPAGLILNNVQVPEVLTSDFFIQELLTCFDIAGRFNVGYQKLVDLNPLVNCQGAGVRPGIRIKIPAEPSYTYTLATAPLDPFGIANLELKIKLDSVGEPRAVDFSPLGDLLAVASGNDIFLWRIGEWMPYRQLRGHLAAVNDIVFSLDGKLIASASNDTSVRVWDMINGTTLNIFYGHEKPVTGVAFDPDRVNLASVSNS